MLLFIFNPVNLAIHLLRCCLVIFCFQVVLSALCSVSFAQPVVNPPVFKPDVRARLSTQERDGEIVRARELVFSGESFDEMPIEKSSVEQTGVVLTGVVLIQEIISQRFRAGLVYLRRVSENLFRAQISSVQNTYFIDENIVRSLAASDGFHTVSFVDLLLGRVQQRVEDYPWIADVNLKVSILPLRVSFYVDEIEPWLVVEYADKTWLVSREGELVQPLSAIHDPDMLYEFSRLPRLDGLILSTESDTSVCSSNTRFNYAMGLLQTLDAVDSFPFVVERYTLLSQGGLRIIPLEFDKYPEVLVEFNDFEGAKETIARLKIVLWDIKKRGEKPRKIDLRFFSQAVVR